MIALRRRDVAELNALARTLMDTHGRLGRERLSFAGTEFATGDRVVCLRNSTAVGVKNGTRGTVEQVDRDRRTLSVVTDRGDRVEVPGRYLEEGHVRHAYAITGHAGQGLTVERAFVLGIGGTRLQEWGYVALSRARQESRLYVTAVPRERESHFHELDERDSVTLLAQALEESAIERLAVDQRSLPSGPLRETRAEIDRAAPTDEQRMNLRLIEQQRLATTKVREEAERELEQAMKKLDRPMFGRRRRKRELEAHIALNRAAMRLSDEQLVQLERQAKLVRDAPRSGDIEVGNRSHELSLNLSIEVDL
jgi:hypothetical protein